MFMPYANYFFDESFNYIYTVSFVVKNLIVFDWNCGYQGL